MNSKHSNSKFIDLLSFRECATLGEQARLSRAKGPGLINLGLSLCAILVASTGCKNQQFVEPKPVTSPVSFLIAGDTNGWIVPCGCSTKQSGGLLRRGTLVAEMNAQHPTIVFDVGGAAAGKSDYHRAKLEAILKGEIAMGLDAHNIGASEAAFGAQVIRQVTSRLSAPLLSSNVCDAQGELIAAPMKIVKRGGLSFAVFGVLDPAMSIGDLQIKEPRQSILDLLDRLEEPVDGKIVLAYLPRESLFDLAKQLPEVDAVIGGPTGQTVAPSQVGATLVASSTNKGKFVVKMKFDPVASKPWTASVVEVDDTLADQPQQVSNLAEYHRVLAKADFLATETGLTETTLVRADTGSHFAGNAACQECHLDDCSHYGTTKHAIAWKTLEVKTSHVDPYCQQCHTTGYGQGSGFASIAKTPQLFNVGCESCHGPSSKHVENVKTRTAFVAKDQCVQCHDRENSPAFEYETYWIKIIHGAKVSMNEVEAKQ